MVSSPALFVATLTPPGMVLSLALNEVMSPDCTGAGTGGITLNRIAASSNSRYVGCRLSRIVEFFNGGMVALSNSCNGRIVD